LLGQAFAMKADISMRSGDAKTAAGLYDRAAMIRPDDADLLRRFGKALAASGDLPGARRAFEKAVAVAVDADLEPAYGDLATFFHLTHAEARCAATLEEATRRVPGSAPLWASLGAAYGRASRDAEALPAYERSVSIAPTPLTLKTLGALVFTLKKDR